MSSPLSRRRFLATGSAGLAAIATLNPLGLLPDRVAHAGIPTGDYLRQLDQWRFWFSQREPHLLGASPELAKPQSQLTLRIGATGGHSVGFLSTTTFLAEYRQSQPDHYKDLLRDIARLPLSESRPVLALRTLDLHRRTANRKQPLRKKKSLPSNQPSQLRANAFISPDTQLSVTLESLTRTAIVPHLQAAQRLRTVFHSPGRAKLTDSAFAAPVHKEANEYLQKQLVDEFASINPTLESRPECIDASALTTYEEGELRLAWVNNDLLGKAYEDGIDMGRLGALAFTALTEISSIAGGANKFALPKPNDNNAAQITAGLANNMREAEYLASCFGHEQFWQYSHDSAAFRPALRLRIIATLALSNGENSSLDLVTSFLPFDTVQGSGAADAEKLGKANMQFATIVTDNFSKPHLVRHRLPKATAAVVDGSFAACPQVLRSTERMIKDAALRFPELKDAVLTSVSLVPELTCPWTFAGIAAAFCNTFLMAVHKEGLNTLEERSQYRQSVSETVDMLLSQSAPQSADKVADSSAVSPAFVQYASGYRAAIMFSDRVTDVVAQSVGARKVYKGLRTALPDRFPELAEGEFLTAEQIATGVFQIASEIQSEITTLRAQVEELKLKVTELTNTIAVYDKYLDDLTDLIDELKDDLSSITSVEELKEWKSRNADLKERITTALDRSKTASLKSLQGLVNTILTVGIQIDATVTAELKANAQVVIGGKGSQKN